MRATAALVATVAGLWLVFSFKTPDTARPPTALSVIPSPAPASSPSASPAGDAPAASPSAPPSSTGLRDGQFAGDDVPNKFGDVQVKVTISGGRIKDVQAVQLPFDRPRSAEISQQAGPLLHDEAIQAQSAQIDTLSGATYTSDSYAQSLQSALDKAR